MRRRFGTLVALLVGGGFGLALALAPGASADTRYRLVNEVPIHGGGMYLQNKVSGYYLGRLFGDVTLGSPNGEHFDSQRYTSYNGSTYHYGYSVGQIGTCMWVGPPSGTMMTGYLQFPSAVTGRCPASGSTAVGSVNWLQSRSNIGTTFNCPDGAAQGPGLTTTSATAGLYYNIAWTSSYSGGGALSNPRGAITVGPNTRVEYRFSTRDGNKAVVYLPGYGWGFMLASKVNVSAALGHWDYASDNSTHDRNTC